MWWRGPLLILSVIQTQTRPWLGTGLSWTNKWWWCWFWWWWGQERGLTLLVKSVLTHYCSGFLSASTLLCLVLKLVPFSCFTFQSATSVGWVVILSFSDPDFRIFAVPVGVEGGLLDSDSLSRRRSDKHTEPERIIVKTNSARGSVHKIRAEWENSQKISSVWAG